ncbi:MAG: ABC transporter permease subunit [Patescibacteria group bacterium]
MIAVIKWTLWQRRWSTLWWAIGIAAFIFLSLSFYASFRDQAAQLNQVLDRLPAAARSLFTGNADFLSPQGFLSARVYYLMLPLLLSFLAIGLGSSLISREEETGTLELLLARPISRTRLLAAKALAGLIITVTVSLTSLVSTLVICKLVKLEIPLGGIVVTTLTCTVLALVFGALAFAMSALGRSARLASVGLSVIVALGGYIISSLAGAVKWLEWPAKFFPYHYYRPTETLAGVYVWRDSLLLLGVTAILLIIAWQGFSKRDLNG